MRFTLFESRFVVWRDPYYRSWGEQLFSGLLTLLGVALVVMVLAEVAQAILPILISSTLIVGLVMWFLSRGRHRW